MIGYNKFYAIILCLVAISWNTWVQAAGTTQSLNASRTTLAEANGIGEGTPSTTDVDVLSLTVNSRISGEKELVIATISMSADTSGGVNRTATLTLTDGTSPTTLDRFISGGADKDAGAATIVDVFTHTGTSATYTLKHHVSKNDIKTWGTLIALPLRTTENGITLNSGVVTGESDSTTDGTATTSSSADPVTNTTKTVSLPVAGGFYVVASFNQVFNTADVTGEWRLQYLPPSGSWTAFGSTASRSLVGGDDVGAISVSGLLQNKAAGSYQFRLVHRRDSGAGTVDTQKVNMAVVALSFDDGTNIDDFDTYEFTSEAVSSDNSFLAMIPSVEFTLSQPTKFFMYSALSLSSEAGETISFAQFKQNIATGAHDGTPLWRYLGDEDSGSAALVDISGTIAVGSPTTYTFSTMELSSDTATTPPTLTIRGTTDGFALTSGSVFASVTTTYAVVANLRAHESTNGLAELTWNTVSETGTSGFHLERWDPQANEYLRLNDTLLPALQFAPQGGSYSFTDFGATPGESYRYRLIEVETDGNQRTIGPYRLTVAPTDYIGVAALNAQGNDASFNSQARAPVESTQNRFKEAFAQQSSNSKKKPINATRVRVALTESGLYSLSTTEIAAALGSSAQEVRRQIANNSLSMSHRGEPVAYLPTHSNAGLMFYAEAIDSIHTHENVYWIELGTGQHIASSHSAQSKATNNSATYRYSHHSEENQRAYTALITDPEADLWHWTYMIAGDGPDDFAVMSPGAAGTGQATLKANLQSTTDLADGNDHHAVVSINGQALGELQWDGITATTFEASFDQAILNNGENIVTITAVKDDGVPFAVFWIESFDLEYERHYNAVSNQLWLRGDNNPSIMASGFSSDDIQVLDITNPLQPMLVKNTRISSTGNGDYQVGFVPVGARQYLATSTMLSPNSLVAATGTNLINTNNEAEYLVISPAALQQGADMLSAYRSTDYSTRVVYLQEIYDAFNHGITNPNAIRTFLSEAYQNWSTQPRFVLLAGRGSFDPKDYSGFNSNLLPILMAPTPKGMFASDARYADIVSDDGVPELAIGRLPVLTNQELEDYVTKLMQYEATSEGAWSTQAVMLADNSKMLKGFDGESDLVAQLLPADFEVTSIHHQLADEVADTRSALFDGLNQGAMLFNYVGHGAPGQLADEGFMTVADMDKLTLDNGQLPIFTALTCTVGNSTFPAFDSLADNLVLHPSGGAIAAFAPTGLSHSDQAHILNKELIKYIFAPGDTNTLGESIQAALAGLAQQGGDRFMLDIYNLFGDPALNP